MFLYIAKRILFMIPTLLGVMLITFTVTQFVPGGPVEKLVADMEGRSGKGSETVSGGIVYRGGSGLDRERLDHLNHLYGFDKPPVQRFVGMMKSYVCFDFGKSYYHRKGVVELVISRMPVSMSLGLWSFLIVYGVCIPLGIKKAVRDGSRFDVFSSTVILVGYAIPGFVLGITLIVLFGGGSFFNIFPLRGLVSDNWSELSWAAKVLDYLWHMVLPVVSSAAGSLAVMTMLTKNSFLEEIGKQYVVTARAKGLDEKNGNVQTCVSECHHSHHNRISRLFYCRILYRQSVDRNYIFPGRDGTACIPVGAEPGLSGSARNPLPVYHSRTGEPFAFGHKLCNSGPEDQLQSCRIENPMIEGGSRDPKLLWAGDGDGSRATEEVSGALCCLPISLFSASELNWSVTISRCW